MCLFSGSQPGGQTQNWSPHDPSTYQSIEQAALTKMEQEADTPDKKAINVQVRRVLQDAQTNKECSYAGCWKSPIRPNTCRQLIGL